MSWVLTILGISALVILHEAGHFAVAKAVGMRVERFSLFFGPMLVKVKIGETEYGIGTIPLGGYVKIAGMSRPPQQPPAPQATAAPARAVETELRSPGRDGGVAVERRRSATADQTPPVPVEDDPRGYFRQPVWKRVAVIAAGPAMNVLVAFLILVGVYWLSAHHASNDRARVVSVERGSPAATVLRSGDTIIAVDGRPVVYADENFNFIPAIANDRCTQALTAGCVGAAPVRFLLERDGRRLSVAVKPRYQPKAKRMLVGFSSGLVLHRYSLAGAVGASVSEMWEVTSKTVSRIGQVFFSSAARKELHGIVGVSDETSEAFSYGFSEAMIVLALISLSLAIVNLFPFLPLDGGHLFWAIAEKVRGRAISFAVMERASVAGFALVLVLAVIGFSNDIHALSNGSLSHNRRARPRRSRSSS